MKNRIVGYKGKPYWVRHVGRIVSFGLVENGQATHAELHLVAFRGRGSNSIPEGVWVPVGPIFARLPLREVERLWVIQYPGIDPDMVVPVPPPGYLGARCYKFHDVISEDAWERLGRRNVSYLRRHYQRDDPEPLYSAPERLGKWSGDPSEIVYLE